VKLTSVSLEEMGSDDDVIGEVAPSSSAPTSAGAPAMTGSSISTWGDQHLDENALNNIPLSFEDDFSKPDMKAVAPDRLPDSQEYLATLQAK